MDPTWEQSEIDRLEALAGSDPASPARPALAEAQRRAGHPERAEAIARETLAERPERLAARVALGLALLDQGRVEQARLELQRVLDNEPAHALAATGLARAHDAPVESVAPIASVGQPAPADEPVERRWAPPPPPAPADDAALADLADPEIEAAFDSASAEPEPMTADTVAEAALHEIDEDDSADEVSNEDAVEDLPVATHTVADLLERQGDPDAARAMRDALHHHDDDAEEAPLADAPPPARTHDALPVLERWLDNLKR